MNAMVIDDSRAMRTIIGQILRGIGFDISEASNGREGLERLSAQTPPRLVMVDWNMPEMNGLEFVKAMRARPEFNATRVMMVTSETEMKRMTEALAEGVDEYLMKPFTKDMVIQKLEQMQIAIQ